jgi:hypothetical protein
MAQRMVSRARTIAYLECKILGHAWDEYNPTVTDGQASFDRLTLRCIRCATTRHDYFDRVGEIERRNYGYPDGYRDAKDMKPSRAAMRLMMHGHSTKGVQ